MSNKTYQPNLSLHKLANLLDQKLLTFDKTSNIRAADTKIDNNNIAIKKIINTITQPNSANNPPLTSTNIKLIEKIFNQNINELKNIKSLVMLAKQASQEPEPSFHIHSLIPTLKILNTFFSRKKHNEIDEMIHSIKQNSTDLQKIFNSLQKINLETDIQILRLISCLNINLKNITSCLYEIQDILDLPPQKKAKKSKKV